MKKQIITLMLLISFNACEKNLKKTVLNRCDCLYGYSINETDYTLTDPNVIKKLHRKLLISKGTLKFWYSCGKSMNYINWAHKQYVFKVGDMDYRIVVAGEKVYTVSEDDENLNKGLIRDESIVAQWGNRQLSLVFEKTENGTKYFSHEVFFEDKKYIGVITFSDEKIKIINAETEFGKYNYILINKYNNDYIENQNKIKRTVRSSDCR